MTESVGTEKLIIEVPTPLAAEVAGTMRRRYPDVIRGAYPSGGETDAQAWRAVAAWWTASLLAEDKADQARTQMDQHVQAATTAREEAIRSARQQAWDAVRAVLLVPMPDNPTTEGEAP